MPMARARITCLLYQIPAKKSRAFFEIFPSFISQLFFSYFEETIDIVQILWHNWNISSMRTIYNEEYGIACGDGLKATQPCLMPDASFLIENKETEDV